MAVQPAPGNVVDRTAFEAAIAALRLPRGGPGRPRTRPDRLIGDKGYPSKKTRSCLRRRGIQAVTPEHRNRTTDRRRKGSRGGRPPASDSETYKQRNLVGRCFGKLEPWRAIATRLDKLAGRYLAGVTTDCLMPWLRQAELSDTLQQDP
ncbi:hypothetical protein GCM10010517_70630 [Streptosporangium fragile]|uniref:Transposase IS4-like domain-containing protein n=2 Tax=Streptosporangium fragile TaxID=46186 RepID=A0ABP6IQG2_9ACTN